MRLRWHRFVLIGALWAPAFPALPATPAEVTIAVPESMIQNAQETPGALVLVREAYRRIGVLMRQTVVPSERAAHDADSGLVDGTALHYGEADSQFPNLIRVPEIVVARKVVAITTGEDFRVDGWRSLSSHKLCIIRGMKLIEDATAGGDRTPAANVAAALTMLRTRRCDVLVIPQTQWQDIDRLDMGNFHELSPPVATISLYHYVHRRMPSWSPY
jgi:polar amino acid transport system substrate-binding protein